MFICAACNKNSISGEKPVKVVLERREKTYKNEDGKISHGHEIVREVLMHEACSKQNN